MREMNTYPRSAYDTVGGLVYFARMLDKIRMFAAGKLPADYHKNLGEGFDGRCTRFLKVEYSVLKERMLQGGSDEEILEWCFKTGRKPSDEEIMIWSAFMRKRGWRDEEEGTTQTLEKQKADNGMGNRNDIVTFFDFFEMDERRKK